MRELTLRFTADNKPASWLIRVFRFGWRSHAEAYMEDGRVLGARWFGGFIPRPWKPAAREWVVTLPVPQALWDEALSLVGAKYDRSGMLAFLVRIRMNVSRMFFCSEVWAYLLKKHGVIVVEDDRQTDPDQLYLACVNVAHGRKGGAAC